MEKNLKKNIHTELLCCTPDANTTLYWVAQKVRSGFSVQCYNKSTILLKPCTSDWDLNPRGGTRTQPKPTVFQLRSHTWFQDLMKLRFLMSHRRKNSVRDKVIGKKWVYLERNTLHRQSVGHLRRQERHQRMGLSVFIGVGNFIG